MREELKKVKLEAIDPDTGEVFPISGTSIKKYYSIKKINIKGNDMALMEKQAYICRSQRDIIIFWNILMSLDYENCFSNVSKIAKDLQIDYNPTIKRVIKKGLESCMWKRVDRGKYLVNPYAFIGRKVRANTKIEELQEKWGTCIFDKKFENWLREIEEKKCYKDIKCQMHSFILIN